MINGKISKITTCNILALTFLSAAYLCPMKIKAVVNQPTSVVISHNCQQIETDSELKKAPPGLSNCCFQQTNPYQNKVTLGQNNDLGLKLAFVSAPFISQISTTTNFKEFLYTTDALAPPNLNFLLSVIKRE